jgi:DNA-binding MarR family transcriptional regulator
VEHSDISKNSSEYAEIVAEIFVETMQNSADKVMCCEHDQEEITPSLMECLQYVYLHAASPIRQIASGLEISLPAVSQLVERLVKKGLVTRTESEVDRRLTNVDLTIAGRELVKQMRQRKSEWFESILKAMPEDDKTSFRNGIEGFLRIALANEDNIDRACVRCGMEHVTFCVVNKVKAERSSGKE